jgi:hypothetical protein
MNIIAYRTRHNKLVTPPVPALGRGSERLLTWLQSPWRSLNDCSLEDAHLWGSDCADSGPQSLHLVWHIGGGGPKTRLSGIP